MREKEFNVKEFMREADRLCPMNPFVKYKNIAINNIRNAISIFLFSLYYWFCLEKRDRDNIKRRNNMRIVTRAYFVKNDCTGHSFFIAKAVI